MKRFLTTILGLFLIMSIALPCLARAGVGDGSARLDLLYDTNLKAAFDGAEAKVGLVNRCTLMPGSVPSCSGQCYKRVLQEDGRYTERPAGGCKPIMDGKDCQCTMTGFFQGGIDNYKNYKSPW